MQFTDNPFLRSDRKRHMRIFWLIVFLVVFTVITYLMVSYLISCSPVVQTAGTDPAPTEQQEQPKEIIIRQLELPLVTAQSEVIQHTGFALVYSEPHEQARWVAYELTRDEVLNKVASRTNRFLPDSKISTGSAADSDYVRSGYDRGHLAPAADMAWSEDAMRESFFFSNISPQVPAFNRGIWKNLEELLRDWAITDTSLCIVTGPVLRDSLPVIGVNQVAVPDYYFKVILVMTKRKQQGIGFLMPNDGTSRPIHDFAVSIDSVQSLTGLNFFYQLPDSVEHVLETTVCLPCWNWKK